MRGAGDVAIEGAKRRRRRGWVPCPTSHPRRDGERDEISARRGLHIPFDPGDLSREVEPRLGPQRQIRSEQPRRIDECISVNLAEAEKLRLAKPRNSEKDALLLWPGEARLKSHHVVGAPRRVLRSQLDHRVGALTGARIE